MPRKKVDDPTVEKVDTRYLENLVGYNARRASLAIIEVFLRRMAAHGLHPVDFSVLSLVGKNPGITSSQLCSALGLKAPNLVTMISALEKRELVERRPHPVDGRAMGVHLTVMGAKLMQAAEKTSDEMESRISEMLTADERRTLIALLKKFYL